MSLVVELVSERHAKFTILSVHNDVPLLPGPICRLFIIIIINYWYNYCYYNSQEQSLVSGSKIVPGHPDSAV